MKQINETGHGDVMLLEKIPVGISSCLLGQRVRYDGGHKSHSYITKTLGEYFEFRPFSQSWKSDSACPVNQFD